MLMHTLLCVLLQVSSLALGLRCFKNLSWNKTCEALTNANCYSSVELVFSSEKQRHIEVRSYGCTGDDALGLFQCRTSPSLYTRPFNISCCRNEDLCNRELQPVLIKAPKAVTIPLLPLWLITALVIATVFVIIVLFVFLHLRFKVFSRFKKQQSLKDCELGLETTIADQNWLCESTLAKEITKLELIGEGSFGEVYVCKWKSNLVAGKFFNAINGPDSWEREMQIYSTPFLNHDHILSFIAADANTDRKGFGFSRVIVTQYHQKGSLYDHLRKYSLDLITFLKMAYSSISGLEYLHSERLEGPFYKPAFVHCDVKSDNFLVKDNMECCIGDFGLAIPYYDVPSIEIKTSVRTRNKTYLAPEILDGSIKLESFSSLTFADIYSYSLVLWQICRRTDSVDENGLKCEADLYELPYETVFPMLPTTREDMCEVMCVKGIRPGIPPRWQKDPVLKYVSEIIQQCWKPNPDDRLTSEQIKLKLIEYIKTHRIYQNVCKINPNC